MGNGKKRDRELKKSVTINQKLTYDSNKTPKKHLFVVIIYGDPSFAESQAFANHFRSRILKVITAFSIAIIGFTNYSSLFSFLISR